MESVSPAASRSTRDTIFMTKSVLFVSAMLLGSTPPELKVSVCYDACKDKEMLLVPPPVQASESQVFLVYL